MNWPPVEGPCAATRNGERCTRPATRRLAIRAFGRALVWLLCEPCLNRYLPPQLGGTDDFEGTIELHRDNAVDVASVPPAELRILRALLTRGPLDSRELGTVYRDGHLAVTARDSVSGALSRLGRRGWIFVVEPAPNMGSPAVWGLTLDGRHVVGSADVL